MDKSTDIAIIGGGLATFAAAVELKASGRHVTVVCKAPGSTALSSGAWDLADSPVRSLKDDWDRLPSVRENLAEIVKREEFHPYSVLGRNSSASAVYEALVFCATRAAAECPLAMVGDASKNMLVATDFGTVKPTAFVQGSMRKADLSAMDRAKVLVVGIRGFPNFNARFIRHALLAQQENQRATAVDFAGHLDVEVQGLANRASLHPIELAQFFDREDGFVAFGQAIVKYLEGKVYSHLLLPPVLGVEHPASILEAIQRITGLQAAETLATPMSVPGWRLSESIRRYLMEREIEILEGEAVGFDCEQRRVKAIRVHDEERRIRLLSKTVLLAGGKYLSGGVRRFTEFKEPVFNLPLFRRGRLLKDAGIGSLAASRAAEIQPFLSAGVAVNPLCQVLDEDGQVSFENLFAAGSILADFDPAHQRCAAGVSLLSGTVAAKSALQLL